MPYLSSASGPVRYEMSECHTVQKGAIRGTGDPEEGGLG